MKISRRTVLQGLTAVGVGALGEVTKDAGGVPASRGHAPEPIGASREKSMAEPLSLWYSKPAKAWLEALPIGNGRLGAMVFGGVAQERLQLNEGTLWAGGPHDYDSPEALANLPEIRRLVFAKEWSKAQDLVNKHFLGRPGGQMPYQILGNLTLTFPDRDNFSDYKRELDLHTATNRTTYTANGVRYTREVLASAVDQVIALRLTADMPGKISFTATFDSPQKSTTAVSGKDSLVLSGTSGDGGGTAGATKFIALLQALPEGGTVQHGKDGAHDMLTVTGANTVVLLLSMATSYKSYQDTSGDAQAKAEKFLNAAAHRNWDQLRQAHVADYQRLFQRVSLHLEGPDVAALSDSLLHPTDARIAAFKEGKDAGLAALHFQYGRYLLLSCSRPGGQAATLQGLWNDSMSPPWGSKYTININTEMNYWPATRANMIECLSPLFQMLSELSVAGQRSAGALYGAGGWMAHHNTDAWRGTAPVDGSFWGMWPSGGAWLCMNLWDHYDYTGDKAALKEHYPIMKGAAEYFLDALVEEPVHKWLVTCPSISPEHGHHPGVSICAGPTMDNQIIHDLFSAVINSSEILKTDADFRVKVVAARNRLAPMQVGSQGQLQEWLEDWDAGAEDIHHRHVSHLYGLFPSSQITKSATPQLFDAARKTLEIRGDAATGWSLAWKINFWARLLDGDRAHKLLADLLTPEHTAPNLFDLHPPFQIDGNFGAVSGVVEMLLQSHTGELNLLPALPSAWPSGSVTGLLARGGCTVDLHWKDGRLHQAKLTARHNGEFRVRSVDAVATIALKAGRPVSLDGNLKPTAGS